MTLRLLRTFALLAAVLVVPACDEGDTIIQYGGPRAGMIAVLVPDNAIVFVDPAAPSVIERILPILFPGAQTADALAFRPSTGNLYVHASDDFFYQVDLVTGGTVQAASFGTGGAGADFGFSIDPVLDQGRLVTNLEDNLIVPMIGGFGPAATDLSVPVRRIAYSNNFDGAATTTLYGVNNQNLVRIGGVGGTPSPDNGVVTVIGPHGGTPGNGSMGFAISPFGTAYMAYGNPTLTSDLWRVDLSTGVGTLIGSMGINIILGIAVVP